MDKIDRTVMNLTLHDAFVAGWRAGYVDGQADTSDDPDEVAIGVSEAWKEFQKNVMEQAARALHRGGKGRE